MSDENFEVAFSGEIADGANLEQVKARVAQMFKADEAKLAHLFSGKRVIIKKNIDRQTAAKYQAALHKAGAVCEVKNCSVAESVGTAQVVASVSGNMPITAPDIPVETPAAPETAPLHISAADIEALPLTVAPVGSDMQDEVKPAPIPAVDISGLDMAPVGSAMSDRKKGHVPPPPDTTGLKIID
jgi:hypothetical protein